MKTNDNAPAPARRLIKIERGAKTLDVTVRTIERWAKKPEMAVPPFVYLGAHRYFDAEEFERWVDFLKTRRAPRAAVSSAAQAAHFFDGLD